MADEHHFSFFAGEDVTITDTIDVGTTDITGWAVTFSMRDSNDVEIFNKTVGSGIVLTTPLTGILTVTIDRADTLSELAGNYNFDISRTDAGAYSTLSYGAITLKKA